MLASNAGSDRSPAWSLNLADEPRAKVLVDRRQLAVVARLADPDEDSYLSREFARLNPGVDQYQKLTSREIPVVMLESARARLIGCLASV